MQNLFILGILVSLQQLTPDSAREETENSYVSVSSLRHTMWPNKVTILYCPKLLPSHYTTTQLGQKQRKEKARKGNSLLQTKMMNMLWRGIDEIRHCDMSTSDIGASPSAGEESRQIIPLLYFLCLSLSITQTQTHTCAQQCVRGRMNFPLKSCWAYIASLERGNTEKKRFV